MGQAIHSADTAILNACLPDRHRQVCLLAVLALTDNDWLHALSYCMHGSASGWRLAEPSKLWWGLRLEARLCEPHQCPCGVMVGPEGIHGLACRCSASRTTRHHAWNDLVRLAIGRANVPAVKEPVGLLRSDGKRPDGWTQIPRQVDKCMTCEVTTYLPATPSTAGRRTGPKGAEIPSGDISDPHFHSAGCRNAQTQQFKWQRLLQSTWSTYLSLH